LVFFPDADCVSLPGGVHLGADEETQRAADRAEDDAADNWLR
jgi:hypothetical protein